MTDRTGTESPPSGDIAESWAHRLAPAAARPYLTLARVDRPIGTWLLLLPCWWGLALALAGPARSAAEPTTGLALGALFTLGAFVMRAAGCVWNDAVDRDYDARVARTAARPIASGAISLGRAFAFMGALALIGLVVLLQFNRTTVWLGLAAVPFIALYPLMKRVTYWPQAWLGLTFNWGALLGWTAVMDSLGAPAIALYGAGFFWTLGYDTIYAHQDKEDDALVGIKSTALLFGDRTRPWLAGFYTATVVLLALAGALAGLAWPYLVGLALGAAQLAWQVVRLDLDDPADCLAKFRSNKWFGLLVVAALVAGGLG